VRIALDPGHGGDNIGCLDGLENELNLEVALAAESIIHSMSCFDPVLTRDCDETVDWLERKAWTDEADLVISIHHNATPNGDPTRGGLELYHWPDNYTTKAICELSYQYAPFEIRTRTPMVIAPDAERYPGAYLVCGVYDQPTILVECCYLTNRGNLAFTESPRYLERMGLFIANMVLVAEGLPHE